ncbi:MAG: hypothetical protein M3295_08000 [Chloroflexota bacterium]|nr:hypothetical protein [Chloroflexota bacterium]
MEPAEATGGALDLREVGRRVPIAWLVSQRWYAGKARTLTGAALRDAARLPAAADERDAVLLLEDVAYADGGRETYALPLVVEADGAALRPPTDDDRVWRRVARLIHAGDELRAWAGTFRFEPAERDARAPSDTGAATERTVGGEQSNTSVAIDDALILKLYRRPEPGESPEVELSRFLSERTSFRGAPRLHGTAHYVAPDGTAWALAILQQLVASEGSAWEWMVERLGDVMRRSGRPAFTILGRDLVALATVTGELHRALASAPSDAFPVRAAGPDERRAWVASAATQLDRALESVRGDDRVRLEELAPAIEAALAPLADTDIPATVTRVHGDFHLGQLLRTRGGFVVIDFEGEPARPAAERRLPHSPLKDVAGMLRSLDYAGLTAARRIGFADPGSSLADRWSAYAAGAFLEPYARAVGAAPDRGLLRAFELEKACYEVAYEAANRPDWLWVPMAGLDRLVRAPDAG